MSKETGRVAGKVALVTGTASDPGIGHSIALTLAREGARVVATDIDEAGAEACAMAIREAGGEAMAIAHDVSSEGAWISVLAATEERFGGLDILVNNAGIAILKPVDALSMQDWQKLVDVNLTGVFIGCQLGLRLLRKRNCASIVNLSSVAGLAGAAGCAAYAATKGGVLAMSRVIAVEEAINDIRCNTIHPGMIWTNMQAAAMRVERPEELTVPSFVVPMERAGTAQDIADMALFLASDESAYVTGSEFVVDGGMMAKQ